MTLDIFQNSKLYLIHLTGLPKDALHICVGMLIFLGAAILTRRPVRDWRLLALVALAACAGECWDLLDVYRHKMTPRYGDNWHDIWLTLLWPTVLFLLARFTRVLKR